MISDREQVGSFCGRKTGVYCMTEGDKRSAKLASAS